MELTSGLVFVTFATMFIVYGTRFYGAVDKMSDGMYVVTRFFHVLWIPLIPTGSYLVTSEIEDGIRGHRIPLSCKSILAAYMRIVLLAIGLAAPILGIWALVQGTDAVLGDIVDWHLSGTKDTLLAVGMLVTGLIVSGLCLLVHVLSDHWFRADPQRQEKIIASIIEKN